MRRNLTLPNQRQRTLTNSVVSNDCARMIESSQKSIDGWRVYLNAETEGENKRI